MFHVEHMKYALSVLFLAIFVLTGCNKPDPNAYRQDPIFLDYQSQLAATAALFDTQAKQRDEILKELASSHPQTGGAAIHRKRVAEAEARLRNLEQQLKYWKIRLESRGKEAQLEYLEAKKNKKTWPDQAAVDSYNVQKRLRLSKMVWDHKDRIEQMKKADQEKAKPKPE
jgi:hypothetical protein